jgi:3-hydroxyacyl-[acyl-carrier-protein] dehydratase
MLKNLGPIEIMKYQQNRHPLLFLDTILEVEPGIRASGTKNFTYNEWFFPSHFEDEPVVPGFVTIECLTQTFLMTILTQPGLAGMKTAFVEIKNASFRRKIVPGETLTVEANLESFSHGLASGKAFGSVGQELACELDLTIAVPEILTSRLPGSRRKET